MGSHSDVMEVWLLDAERFEVDFEAEARAGTRFYKLRVRTTTQLLRRMEMDMLEYGLLFIPMLPELNMYRNPKERPPSPESPRIQNSIELACRFPREKLYVALEERE